MKKTQCNNCKTIFTGIGTMQCPSCEGQMHEIEYSEGTISLPRKPVIIGLWLVVIGLLIANVIMISK